MFVGVSRMVLFLHDNRSLKGKRKVVRSVVDRTRAKFNAAVAEVDANDSQKQIVIGRQGEMLGAVGRAARLEIEGLLERKVALNLWVKVRDDWRNDERMLREMGL